MSTLWPAFLVLCLVSTVAHVHISGPCHSIFVFLVPGWANLIMIVFLNEIRILAWEPVFNGTPERYFSLRRKMPENDL
jgi:hypothetical protein